MNNDRALSLTSVLRKDFQNVATIFFMPAMYVAKGLMTGLSLAVRASEQALLASGRETPLAVKSKTRDEAGGSPRVRATGRS